MFSNNKVISFLILGLHKVISLFIKFYTVIKSRIKIIDRYIGSQVLITTIFSVVVLSFVLVIGELLKELLKLKTSYDISIFFIVKFIIISLPPSLFLTIPWGFLTAILLVFGRLSADNELISFRMAGLNIFRICASSIFISILIFFICYLLNSRIAPASLKKISSVLLEQIQKNPMALFKVGEGIETIPNHIIYVGKKEGNKLMDLFLVQTKGADSSQKYRYSDSPKFFLSAKEATVENNLEEKSIRLLLNKVHFTKMGALYPKSYDGSTHGILAEEHTIPIENLNKSKDKNNINPEILNNKEIKEILSDKSIKLKDKVRNTLSFTISQRYALSLASITFLLLGIPLGITTQRRETSVGFVISLVISLTYFLFMVFSSWMKEDPGIFPYIVLWFPNILFLGLGIILFYRLYKK